MGSFTQFGPAMVAFTNAIRKTYSPGQEMLLAGQLEDVVDWGAPEWTPATGIILFYRCRCLVPGEGSGRESEIEQVNDPTLPILLQFPYFASYDRAHKMILFYDGGLRRVEEGKETSLLDLSWFDYSRKEVFDEGVTYEAR